MLKIKFRRGSELPNPEAPKNSLAELGCIIEEWHKTVEINLSKHKEEKVCSNFDPPAREDERWINAFRDLEYQDPASQSIEGLSVIQIALSEYWKNEFGVLGEETQMGWVKRISQVDGEHPLPDEEQVNYDNWYDNLSREEQVAVTLVADRMKFRILKSEKGPKGPDFLAMKDSLSPHCRKIADAICYISEGISDPGNEVATGDYDTCTGMGRVAIIPTTPSPLLARPRHLGEGLGFAINNPRQPKR